MDMEFDKNIRDDLEKCLQNIQNERTTVEEVKNDESLNRSTENNHRAQEMEAQDKLSRQRAKLGTLKEARLKCDEAQRETIALEQKSVDKLTKKLKKTVEANKKWRAERDNLQRLHLKTLTAKDNVKRLLEHLGLGFGAEDRHLDGQSSFYLTKIHPNDPNMKYYIYFTHLKLTNGEFEVSTISPKFSAFNESTRIEMNKKSIPDLLAFCMENWKKDMTKKLKIVC